MGFPPTPMLVFLALLVNFKVAYADERVLLKEVTAITLQRGQRTTGRRSAPVPQLRCVGGEAQGVYAPKTVQCYNRGFDGSDVQWECIAPKMDNRYDFGKITVTCEGYDYPNDPYILQGSCGLEYEMEYTALGKGKREHNIGLTLMIAFSIAYMIYNYFSTRAENRAAAAAAAAAAAGDGGGGPPPHPPGWRPGPGGGGNGGGGGGGGNGPGVPPPPYDDINGKSGSTQDDGAPASSSGPGFWSGAAAGAAAAYLAGRAQSAWSDDNATRHAGGASTSGTGQSSQSAGWFEPHDDWEDRQRESSRQTDDQSSHGEHESSAFGGTTRR